MNRRPVSTPQIPDAPPREVLEAVSAAAGAYDRLQAAGRRLHFDLHAATGRLTVEVLDREGNRLATVRPSAVLEIAAGAPLP